MRYSKPRRGLLPLSLLLLVILAMTRSRKLIKPGGLIEQINDYDRFVESRRNDMPPLQESFEWDSADNQIPLSDITEDEDLLTTPSVSTTDSDETNAKSERSKAGTEEPIKNSVRKDVDKYRYWDFQLLDGGERVDCQIHTSPIATAKSSTHSSSSTSIPTIKEYKSEKEQYIVHIHGLHHTGTGYLRQTLADALNREFSQSEYTTNTNNASSIASIHDSTLPYKEEIQKIRTSTNDHHVKGFSVPENEGQHLQSIYPRFADRMRLFGKSNKRVKNAGKMAYVTDHCIATNNDNGNSTAINKEIGNILFQQWSRFWDTSATFLLQKTPTLDVLFHERTKILPTLHIIIVRHPMTSNSWGSLQMGLIWLTAFTHVFELLGQGEIEWYAVVTYEALVTNHDNVVEELMEVVKSGMRRNQSKGQSPGRSASNFENAESKTRINADTRQAVAGRRRLHLRDTKKSPVAYLIPKQLKMAKWKSCMDRPSCQNFLKRLTKNILPFFGFVSVDNQSIRRPKVLTLPLSASPGTVTVTKESAHVLFSSEGAALSRFRKSRDLDFKPPPELISRMQNLLAFLEKKKSAADSTLDSAMYPSK